MASLKRILHIFRPLKRPTHTLVYCLWCVIGWIVNYVSYLNEEICDKELSKQNCPIPYDRHELLRLDVSKVVTMIILVALDVI
jgi:hypothetical protein